MPHDSRFHLLGAAAAFALLAGCGGATSVPEAATQLIPRSGQNRISLDTTNSKLLYIARYSSGDVRIYNSRTLALVGSLSGITNPQGVALDSRRNVYVVDQGLNVVKVFHRGAGTPFETLTDPDGSALQVAVGNDGTVYLSNEYNHFGNGNVAEYPPGKTLPNTQIDDPHFSVVEDVGLDSHDNLYVTFFDEHSVGRVNEYPPGANNGKRLPIALNGAGGIEFDSSDDLVLADPNGKAVKVFAQGSSKPKYEFAHNQFDPWDVALARHSTRAFVTDPFTGNTYEYALPSGKRLHVISNPRYFTTGVAVER